MQLLLMKHYNGLLAENFVFLNFLSIYNYFYHVVLCSVEISLLLYRVLIVLLLMQVGPFIVGHAGCVLHCW